MKLLEFNEKVMGLETGHVYILSPFLGRDYVDLLSEIRNLKVVYIKHAPKKVVRFRRFNKGTVILPYVVPDKYRNKCKYKYLICNVSRDEVERGVINAYNFAGDDQYNELKIHGDLSQIRARHEFAYSRHYGFWTLLGYSEWEMFTNIYSKYMWGDFWRHLSDRPNQDKYPEYLCPCEYDRRCESAYESNLVNHLISDVRREHIITSFERKYGKPFFKDGKIMREFWHELDRYKECLENNPILSKIVGNFGEFLSCKEFMERYGDLSINEDCHKNSMRVFWQEAVKGVFRSHQYAQNEFNGYIADSPQLNMLAYHLDPGFNLNLLDEKRLYTESEVQEQLMLIEKLFENNGHLAIILETIMALDHQEIDKEKVFAKWLYDIRKIKICLDRDKYNNLEISFDNGYMKRVLKGGDFQYINTCYLMYLIKDIDYKEQFRGKADVFIDRMIECYWGDHSGMRIHKQNVFDQWCEMWQRKGFAGYTNKAVGATLASMNLPKHLIYAFHIPDVPMGVATGDTLINRDRLKNIYNEIVLPSAMKINPGSHQKYRCDEWTKVSSLTMRNLRDLEASKTSKGSARSSISFQMPKEY